MGDYGNEIMKEASDALYRSDKKEYMVCKNGASCHSGMKLDVPKRILEDGWFEHPTFRMQSGRSTNWAKPP